MLLDDPIFSEGTRNSYFYVKSPCFSNVGKQLKNNLPDPISSIALNNNKSISLSIGLILMLYPLAHPFTTMQDPG